MNIEEISLWLRNALLPFGGIGLMVLAMCDSSFVSLPEVNDVLLMTFSINEPESMVKFALLTTLGVTTGSAGAAVQKAWAKAEGPLWDSEVSAAIANAAWQNPAPMGSVEAIQLLLAVGEKPNARTETLARHPNLVVVRNIPVGRIGVILAVVTTAISVFEADANHLNRDASFFLPPLFLVAFLVLIDGWDILISLATKQTAPYLALPDRIALPEWIMPVAQVLAPVFLLTGLLAGHFFWH